MLKKRMFVQFCILMSALALATPLAQSQSLHVIVSANSGLPNQTFDLTSSADISQAQNDIQGLPSAPDPNWVNMGWRGYHIVNQGVSSFPQDVTVLRGVIRVISTAGSTPIFYQDLNHLETFLASKASSSSSTSTSGTTAAQTASRTTVNVDHNLPGAMFAVTLVDGGGGGGTPSPSPSPTPAPSPSPSPTPTPSPTPLPKSGSEPKYDPTTWNDGGAVQANNNCYNYACNKPTGTFAQPGVAGGKPIAGALSCASVTAAATADGLVSQDCSKACPAGNYKVALVVDPTGFAGDGLGPDFHWYRQDDNGNWSHKPGDGEATNQDSSSKPIIDPSKADRRREGASGTLRPGYTNFCGCFCVNADPTKVTIR